MEFKPYGCLYSEIIKNEAGKLITYLHGLTIDGYELLLTPAKRRKGRERSFILWKRLIPSDLRPPSLQKGEDAERG